MLLWPFSCYDNSYSACGKKERNSTLQLMPCYCQPIKESILRIITVGNKPDPATTSLIDEYEKRLRGSSKLELVRLKAALGTIEQIRNTDSANILAKLKPSEALILLDERGKNLSSEEFAEFTNSIAGDIVFVIGGAYGVNEELRQKAKLVLKLSDFVLPHRLALLVLVEQIYRAQCINNGHPYHHSG